VIDNDSNSKIFLTPLGTNTKLLVNGKAIDEKTEMRHNDRLVRHVNIVLVLRMVLFKTAQAKADRDGCSLHATKFELSHSLD